MGTGTASLWQLVSIIQFNRYCYRFIINTDTNSYTHTSIYSYANADTDTHTHAIPFGMSRVQLCAGTRFRIKYL
jgi:hypothetical protein